MILFPRQYNNLVHTVRNNIQILESLGKQVEHRTLEIEQVLMQSLDQIHSLTLTSPTGQQTVRVDPEGDGHFTAPRGARRHTGLDFTGTPGQEVTCPVPYCTVTRTVRPYAGSTDYSGLELVYSNLLILHVLYIRPAEGVLGKKLTSGEPIGTMQDISKRYSAKMQPHVHVNVYINPEVLMLQH